MDSHSTPFTAQHAPGAPGLPPNWSGGTKQAVGTALDQSRLWYTIGDGIVNEVYYPRADIPQIRDLGFIIADNNGFWVEAKRLADPSVELASPGVPAVHVLHHHPQFTLSLRITPDSPRDVLLLELQLDGKLGLQPYVLLAPHLGGTGRDNRAAVERYSGRRILWAEQGPFALALAAVDTHQRDAFGRASAGYADTSDGWQDFARHGAMRWEYASAGPGNVALLAELPRYAVLALGFGSSKESAATLAISALLQPFGNPWRRQIEQWTAWHNGCNARFKPPDQLAEPLREMCRTSAMVLRAHQDKIFPGAMVASLSVPWGERGNERGGYHLVWPRDLVGCAGALLAIGAEGEARDALRYLIATQRADGHWYQNQWLGGKPFWRAIQLDEVAFPVLLAAALAERDALGGIVVQDMVRRALGFIARHGPASEQDRWEEVAGINVYTLGVCISALVAGAHFLAPPARAFALALADFWNASIEQWTVAYGTPLARSLGIDGYYVREAHLLPSQDDEAAPQIATDFLQLVRFGLRRPEDPLIVDTLKAVDRILKVETTNGAAWLRYDGDLYGEYDDGRPYDGHGRGRAWPLLALERGHYELAAGRDPTPALWAAVRMSAGIGMIPEQIWDAAEIPSRRLFPGRPSGSAAPLVWAHAEYLKLVHSIAAGRPFDRPEAVWRRYHGRAPALRSCIWLNHAPIGEMLVNSRLLVCSSTAAEVHWSRDGWRTAQAAPMLPTGLDLMVAELATEQFEAGTSVEFTCAPPGAPAAPRHAVRIVSQRTGRAGHACTSQHHPTGP